MATHCATRAAALTTLLRTSDSHTRTTRQRRRRSWRVTRVSRCMFVSIFAIQYVALLPLASRSLRLGHFLPCQKSPSTKTTTLRLTITMSGFPGSCLQCNRNLSPSRHSSLRNITSEAVCLLGTAALTRDASGELGEYDVNRGTGMKGVRLSKIISRATTWGSKVNNVSSSNLSHSIISSSCLRRQEERRRPDFERLGRTPRLDQRRIGNVDESQVALG